MSLLTALRSENERLVETICASGASANELENGAAPLHIAVGMQSSHDFSLTKILLQYGGDPNVESDEKLTPVHVSVIWGKDRILNLLLKHGGDPTKRDEDNKDAWDYCLKYGRRRCMSVLQTYLDKEADSFSSDDESDKYISIFSRNSENDVNQTSRSNSMTSELNRRFISLPRSSLMNNSDSPEHSSPHTSSPSQSLEIIKEEVDGACKPVKEESSNPRPPPRKLKGVGRVINTPKVSDYNSIDECRYARSYSFDVPDSMRLPDKHRYKITRSMSVPTSPKTHINKSDKDSPVTKDKKSKRSPLSILTRSPSKALSKLIAKISPRSSKNRHEDSDLPQKEAPKSSATVQHHLSERDKVLLRSIPKSVGTANPDNCIIIISNQTPNTERKQKPSPKSSTKEKCSPSNYTITTIKPEKLDKKIGSPFRFRSRRKSLFGKVAASSKHSVMISPTQTIQLSQNDCDITSQISLPESNAASESSGQLASRLNTDSTNSSEFNEQDLQDIEDGRKVFDVTSPDHCVVVAVNDRQLEQPLDKTVVYEDTIDCTDGLWMKDTISSDITDSPKLVNKEYVKSNKLSSTQSPKSVNFDLDPRHPVQVHSPAHSSEYSAPSQSTAPNKPPRLYTYNSPQSTNYNLANSILIPAPLQFQVETQSAEHSKSDSSPSTPMTDISENVIGSQSTAADNVTYLPEEDRLTDKAASHLECSRKPGVKTYSLNHRWCKKTSETDAKIVGHCQLEGLTVNVDEDVVDGNLPQPCKDSGIGSSSEVFRKRRPTECSNAGSDDSFHTCPSGVEMSESSTHGERPTNEKLELPTEVDSLLAKVSRMNLDEYNCVSSGNESCDSTDIIGTSLCRKKYNMRPSLITHAPSDVSIVEYLYTDTESNITLTECRLPITEWSDQDNSSNTLSWKELHDLSVCVSNDSSSELSVSVPEDIINLSDSDLVQQLREAGDVPGPVTETTRKVYQMRLTKLRENPQLKRSSTSCSFSYELQQFMSCQSNISLDEINQWEHEMISRFDNANGKTWREGNSKMSFNYLLLDPRTTKNLPARHHILDSNQEGEAFRTFLSSIFYVGKGKKTRPYQHFIDAIRKKNCSDKTRQIIDIWHSGSGVVSLHIFHNTIPVEAYTREACMVEAIGLKNLTNIAKCNYYGVASTWSTKRKHLVGASLLYKAFNILLIEGERQIKPTDIRNEDDLPSFLL